MVNSPLLRPYLLGGWHWGGPLRFPWCLVDDLFRKKTLPFFNPEKKYNTVEKKVIREFFFLQESTRNSKWNSETPQHYVRSRAGTVPNDIEKKQNTQIQAVCSEVYNLRKNKPYTSRETRQLPPKKNTCAKRYHYYAMKILNRPTPWKKWITKLQIVQFATSFALLGKTLWHYQRSDCAGMKALVYNCIFNATLIVQFIGVDKRNKATQKKEWWWVMEFVCGDNFHWNFLLNSHERHEKIQLPCQL